MERRLLLAFQNVVVNDPTDDPVGIDANYNTQSETSTIVFTPSGASAPRVITAYIDQGELLNGRHGIGWAVSTDGGREFADNGNLPFSSDTSSGVRGDGADPVLARDNVSGKIYLVTLEAAASAPNSIHVYRSTDDGDTFAVPVRAFAGSTVAFDKPWIAVDNVSGTGQGNVYVMAVDFQSGAEAMRFVRSTDGGDTWGSSIAIASFAGSTFYQGANVAVGADHAVYAFYDKIVDVGGLGVISYDLEVRKSTDLGISFASAVPVASLNASGFNGLGLGFRSNVFPQVVANPANADQLFVAYADKTSASDRTGVYLVGTDDGGVSWDAPSPTLINDDATTRDQWQPSLAIKPDGSQIFAGWYDRAGDDSILGAGGDDFLKGDDDDDILRGGAGSDRLEGGNHDDFLDSADGDIDSLLGGAGQDSIDADTLDVLLDSLPG